MTFVHVDPWPGYKAGACNLALRQYTDPKAEIIGMVDADDLVKPYYLKEVAPYFCDEKIGFVQTCEGNRDYELVRNRIEERPQPRGLPEPASQIAVKRIRDAGGRKQQSRGRIRPRVRHVEQQHYQRDRGNAKPCECIRQIPGHRDTFRVFLNRSGRWATQAPGCR